MPSHSQTIALFRALFPHRLARWSVFVGAWLLLGAISAINWQLLTPPGVVDYTWWMIIRVKMALWLMWGLFTIGILTVSARFRIEKENWFGNSIALILFSGIVVALYLIVYTVIVYINALPVFVLGKPLGLFRWIITTHLTYYYLAFWFIVGVEHAVAYYRRYHEREMHAAKLKTELAEAQLTALRYHLQPHFLFNTLHSVVALVRKADNKKAISMLTGLSDLLRHALVALKRHEVPLSEELSLLEKYVAIENIRFSDRLTIHVDLSPECKDALVPSFLFQPLVENAIRHGIEKRPGAGEISIAGSCNKDRLVLKISDDGIGLQPVPSGQNDGIGLSATRRRLESLYGDSARLELSPREPNGTLVTIILPIRRSVESLGSESARTA